MRDIGTVMFVFAFALSALSVMFGGQKVLSWTQIMLLVHCIAGSVCTGVRFRQERLSLNTSFKV